jgi:hypothetical protein
MVRYLFELLQCYQYKYTFELNTAPNSHSHSETNRIEHLLHAICLNQLLPYYFGNCLLEMLW